MAQKTINIKLRLTSDTQGINSLPDSLDRTFKSIRAIVADTNRDLKSSTNSLITDLERTWDKLEFNPGEILGQGLNSLFDGGGVEGLFKSMFGSVSGDLSKLLTAGVGDIAGMALDLFGGGFGGKLASDLISTVGGDLVNKAMSLGGELVGDLGKSLGSIFGGGSIGPEEALSYIEKANAHIEMIFSTMDSGQASMVAMDKDLADMTERMMQLAETAGYSQEEIKEMVMAINPELGQALLAAASPAGQAASAIQDLAVSTQNFSNISGESEEALVRWARSVGLSEDQVRLLVAQLRQGDISAEQFASTLGTGNSFFDPFIQGAQDAIQSLNGFNHTMGQTNQGMPNAGGEPVILGNINDGIIVPMNTMHSGGAVARYAHSGLLVPRLYPDEVPLIARRGEFVVRAESVTPTSLPWLQALNQNGGSSSPGHGDLHINAPMVEIHGNVLGSEDTVEDLARLVESKLRDLAAARYA